MDAEECRYVHGCNASAVFQPPQKVDDWPRIWAKLGRAFWEHFRHPLARHPRPRPPALRPPPCAPDRRGENQNKVTQEKY